MRAPINFVDRLYRHVDDHVYDGIEKRKGSETDKRVPIHLLDFPS